MACLLFVLTLHCTTLTFHIITRSPPHVGFGLRRASFLSSTSPPPKPELTSLSKPKQGAGLFQLDTPTAARSKTLPDIELNAGSTPVQMLANAFPGNNTDTSSWNITDATPSSPPSVSVFLLPPPRRSSLTGLRKIDRKPAERLGPPKLQVRFATLAAPPSATSWSSGGGGNGSQAHTCRPTSLSPT
ncbi:hypothetical protein BGW80DRAFT_1456818 [Lactifluus volemus]|nr:hypothetical protein BGW80DRAFT_1456818 [Lactifluus volemus]